MIREAIGFHGLLMTDDLSMKALTGDFTERASTAVEAGCDVVLHCNGDMAEMQAVMKGVGKLRGAAKRRAETALQRIARDPEPLDEAVARMRFAQAFGPQTLMAVG